MTKATTKKTILPEIGTIHSGKNRLFFGTIEFPEGDVHFCRRETNHRKIHVNVGFLRGISKVDLPEMTVLFLWQVERELIVDGQIVCETNYVCWFLNSQLFAYNSRSRCSTNQVCSDWPHRIFRTDPRSGLWYDNDICRFHDDSRQRDHDTRIFDTYHRLPDCPSNRACTCHSADQ